MMPDSPTTLLLVDDRPDGILALEAVLQGPAYRLIKAHSGRSALTALAAHDVDVILLDVQMPVMDGFETARRIRQDRRTREIPIVFITAISRDMTYVHEGYDAGGIDYILKPFDPHILTSKVAILADLNRKSRTIQEQAARLRESERRERERQLADLEIENLRRYHSLADAIPHIVWRMGPDGSSDYFNRSWSESTGLPSRPSGVMGWRSAFHPNDMSLLLSLWEAAGATAQPVEAESRILTKDGTYRWHLVRIVAEFDREGRLAGWIGTGTDIHERKRSEQERDSLLASETAARRSAESANSAVREVLSALQEKTRALETANCELEQFAFVASHDLREPLRKIAVFGGLLMEQAQSAMTDEATNYVGRMIGAANRMNRLIDGLLQFGRLGGKREPFEKVELGRLVGDVLTELEEPITDSGARISVDALPVLQGNRLLLSQLLQNLISNAIKFRRDTKPEIRISATEDEQEWTISLRDNGIGIEPEHRDRIFTIFQRLHPQSRYPGTGIGLSICKKIVEIHGGRIWVESRPGEGSTFHFTFPRSKALGKKSAALNGRDTRPSKRARPATAAQTEPAEEALPAAREN